MPAEQPTLTDGVVTLRPWRESDTEEALAGHDAEMAHWFGWDPAQVTPERHLAAIANWRRRWAAGEQASFVVEHDGRLVGSVELTREGAAGASVSWTSYAGYRRRGFATRAVRVLVDWALSDTLQGGLGLQRVEARVEPDNTRSLSVATRAGMHREGVQRVVPGMGERPEATGYVVFSRLTTDAPLTDPGGFRSLLNSFLPRKRAISQLLVRDPGGRVLLCQLTYKRDWDLPGGVVEVGESPRIAVQREIEEELGLAIEPGDLLLTDWLPAWGGWDDAVCLVFDGGTLPAAALDEVVKQEREIRDVRFCTLVEVDELAADFTARRVRAAVGGDQPYTESGR